MKIGTSVAAKRGEGIVKFFNLSWPKCLQLFFFLFFLFFCSTTRGSKKWEPERNKGKVKLLSVSTSWSLRADQPVSPFLGCWSGCRLSAVCCALAGDDVVKIKWCHRHFSQMHSQIFLCHTRKVGSFKGSISSKWDPYRQCISRLSRYEKSTYSTFLICL